MKLKLTDLTIRSLPIPERGQADYYDLSYPGLCLRVSQGGSKVFTFIHRKGGDRQRHTIGKYGQVTLSEAREACRKLTLVAIPGKSISYDDALDLYVKHHLAHMRQSHRIEAERLLRRHFPFKTLDEITKKDVITILDTLTPSIADHALRRLNAFLNWCIDRDYITVNPLQRLKIKGARNTRDRVLSEDELRAIWHAASQMGTFGAIIQLLILTGCRRNEIASLQLSWIQNDVIVFPKEMTKGNREHILPTAPLARETLQTFAILTATREKPFNAWSKNKRKLDALSGVSEYMIYDLRRSFRTNLSRWNCCTPHIAELLIGHKGGSDIQQTYDRWTYLPEKRAALEAYETHLQQLFSQSNL